MYVSYSDVTRDLTFVVESKLPARKFLRRGSNNHAENIKSRHVSNNHENRYYYRHHVIHVHRHQCYRWNKTTIYCRQDSTATTR